MDFLNEIFKQNGYNDRQIKRATRPARVTPEPVKTTSTA